MDAKEIRLHKPRECGSSHIVEHKMRCFKLLLEKYWALEIRTYNKSQMNLYLDMII